MNSLESHFLIAAPQLLDPNFVKTVVLIIQHTDQGALGLVLNRPTSKTVKELWSEVGDAHCQSEHPVYLGGPVSGPLMAIHADRSLAEMEILPGVFFAAKKASLDELVDRDDDCKLFVGHAGWGPGQLDAEIEAGGWLIAPAAPEYVFYDGDDLWDTVMSLTGTNLAEMLNIKQVPDDPSVN